MELGPVANINRHTYASLGSVDLSIRTTEIVHSGNEVQEPLDGARCNTGLID